MRPFLREMIGIQNLSLELNIILAVVGIAKNTGDPRKSMLFVTRAGIKGLELIRVQFSTIFFSLSRSMALRSQDL